MTTPFHARYFAEELTKRCPSDSIEKLATVLADAQVDLNPHQIEAALFAFQSPFSKGAILADEVGLGKTIEAGLLFAQKWAERKRRLLVILPANLRKQSSQELADKFYLPSVIMESKTFNDTIKAANLNSFQQEAIILCSYQFARTKEPYIRQTKWDLIVIDEAHRLRNVYKNTSKIAASNKLAVAPFPKVLLTATPLQNSLLELYGLVSIIDDYAFGDLPSYRSRFSRLTSQATSPTLRIGSSRCASAPSVVRSWNTSSTRTGTPSCRSSCLPRRSSGSTTSFLATSRARRSTPCRQASGSSSRSFCASCSRRPPTPYQGRSMGSCDGLPPPRSRRRRWTLRRTR